MTEKILFQGGANALSNMAAYAIEWRGESWMTVEHAYQAAKFDGGDIYEQIKSARSAYDSKRIADENLREVRSDWVELKLSIMEELVRKKIEQHPHIKKKLKNLVGKEIVEDTEDAFWGRGKDGGGENHLGKLWMKLRDEIV